MYPTNDLAAVFLWGKITVIVNVLIEINVWETKHN